MECITTIIECNTIGNTGAASIAAELKTNVTLTTLDIGNKWNINPIIGANNIEEKGAASIAEVLKTNTTLTTLDIGININRVYPV